MQVFQSISLDTLERSILSKSTLVTDPIKIQAAANLENIPGIKMKSTTEEWANADHCAICKQPFNPNRNVNRHHWYFYYNAVVFVEDQSVGNVREKESIMRDHVISVSLNNI